jgi:hypothetical protein
MLTKNLFWAKKHICEKYLLARTYHTYRLERERRGPCLRYAEWEASINLNFNRYQSIPPKGV